MFSAQLRGFLYGVIITTSLVSVITYASGTDGVFGDYFERMIDNSGICTNSNIVVVGFSASPYGTKICRTIKDLMDSAGIHSDTSENIGIGTNTPSAKLDVNGNIKFGDSGIACSNSTEGQQRYNFTSKKMEYCDSSSWKESSGGEEGGLQFGGTYLWRGGYGIITSGCEVPNSVTNDCSCPAGYTAKQSSKAGYYYWSEWDAYYWGYTCEKIGGGGTSGGLGWENVPLTDTTDFDETCYYRIQTADLGGATYRYSAGVGKDNIFFGYNIKSTWIGGSILKADKSIFDVGGGYGTFSVIKLEKRCGNTNQVGYTKVCDVAYASPSFAAPSSSHMHSIPVPDSWTNETCRGYMWQTKGGAAQVRYRLGCINNAGVSQGLYSSINAGTADAGIPAANCGW